MSYPVVKARISDVPQMHKLINHFADRGEMLARPLSELYENIRNFFVVRNGDTVLGCGALGICWSDLAEIKSLAVIEGKQLQGIGGDIVRVCLDEARELEISTVFCLTYKPGFFQKMGFSLIDKEKLPRKVWGECYRCPKYPDCDEIAMIYHL
ncbi:MAG: N-acetyltransferase [Chloroflexota bacterium]